MKKLLYIACIVVLFVGSMAACTGAGHTYHSAASATVAASYRSAQRSNSHTSGSSCCW